MKDNELKTDYHDIYEDSRSGWQNFNKEASLDLDSYLDAQFTQDEYEEAQIRKRALFVVNKLARQVNLLEGYEIKNRHILKIAPVGGEDNAVCTQMTGLIMNLMNFAGGYDFMSEAFKWGSLVTGSNLLEVWRDRNGDLQFNRLGWNQFLLNPSLTKGDLSDCPDILTGRWLPTNKIKMLVPTADIEDTKTARTSIRWENLGDPYLISNGKLRLYEEWWRKDTAYDKMVVNKRNGQEFAWTDFVNQNAYGDKDLANRLIAETKSNGIPILSKYNKPKDVIKLTIFVDDEPVWDGTNPLFIDDYNFVWLHGEFVPESNRDDLKLRGYVRRLRDPQQVRNKRINQAIDIIESQIQTGRIIRDKYLKNPEDAYKSGQAVVLHVEDGLNAPPDNMPMSEIFHQFNGNDIGQGIFALMESLDKDTVDAGGLNEEIFGTEDRDQPAILSQFRTGQALTGQGGLFQSFRAAKRALGLKLVKLIQANYAPSQVKRIINEIPASDFYKVDFARYDCTPTEGLLTDTQQNMFYLELKQLRTEFPDAAQAITISDLIEAAPIQFKDKLKEVIKQREQAVQQQQQQIQQIAMQDKQRMDMLTEAKIRGEMAESQENIAEAEENRANAALDRVNTMAKINEINSKPYVALAKLALEMERIQIEKVKLARDSNKEKVGAK